MSKSLTKAKSDERDIHAKLLEFAHDARDAFSDNTQRAIQGDTRHFTTWCNETQRTALPATPETLCAYIDDMAENYAATTIRRRISSISHLHRAAQLQDPASSNKVRLALRRMQRRHGKRPKQAQGLTETDIAAILATTPNALGDLRDKALLLTARDLLTRRSELVAIDIEDITISDDGSATTLIKKSKTDQEGNGVVLWLSRRSTQAIQNWINAAEITQGPLFRSLRKGGHVSDRLCEGTVSSIFKRMAKRAGIDHHHISGHSTRIGMAQDLSTAGAELSELMTAGRWKSPQMPARYTEYTRASRGAVAKYYERIGTNK